MSCSHNHRVLADSIGCVFGGTGVEPPEKLMGCDTPNPGGRNPGGPPYPACDGGGRGGSPDGAGGSGWICEAGCGGAAEIWDEEAPGSGMAFIEEKPAVVPAPTAALVTPSLSIAAGALGVAFGKLIGRDCCPSGWTICFLASAAKVLSAMSPWRSPLPSFLYAYWTDISLFIKNCPFRLAIASSEASKLENETKP